MVLQCLGVTFSVFVTGGAFGASMSSWGPGCLDRFEFVTVIVLMLFGSGNFWLRSVVFLEGLQIISY